MADNQKIPWLSSVCESEDGNPDLASLKQLIAEFKSSLVHRKINLKGKLTLTIQSSSEVDVQFHPPTPKEVDEAVSSPSDVPSSFLLPADIEEHQNLKPNNVQLSVPVAKREGNPELQSSYIFEERTELENGGTTIFTAGETDYSQMPFQVKNNFFSRNEAVSGHSLSKPGVCSLNPQAFYRDSILLNNKFHTPANIRSSEKSLHDLTSALLSDQILAAPNNNVSESCKLIVPLTSSITSLPSFENIIQQRFPAVQSEFAINTSNISYSAQMRVSGQSCTISLPHISDKTQQVMLKQYVEENTLGTMLIPEQNKCQESAYVSPMVTDSLLYRRYENVSRLCPIADVIESQSHVFAESENSVGPQRKEDVTSESNSLSGAFSSNESFKTFPKTETDEVQHGDITEYDITLSESIQNGSVRQAKHEHTGSLNVSELETLSHKELVAILTQVLQGQDINYTSVPASNTLESQTYIDEPRSTSVSTTLKSHYEAEDKPDKRKVKSASRLFMNNSTTMKVPKLNKADRKLKGQRKYRTKTEKLLMVQRSGDGTCKTEAAPCIPTRPSNTKIKDLRISLRKRKTCEANTDGAHDKLHETELLQKSSKLTTLETVDLTPLQPPTDVNKSLSRSHNSGFRCCICGKTLKTKDSLYHHQRGLHTKDKPYKCDQCSATFSFHHSYKLHMQRHSGERPYHCIICNKTYLTSNHLKVHVEAVHGVGRTVCHVCGKTFSYKCSLKQHLCKHTGERSYPCNKCEKGFTTKQSLQAHTASHIEGRNCQCGICGTLFKSEHSKNIHMRRHGSQVRQFICELCGKAFLFKSALKAHINVHSKGRPYMCQQCGKAFKSKASLYTHKYVHRDTQPFICSICGKAFKTKSCCSSHMKRHKNENSYTCSQCGSAFPDKGGLSKHIKTIHTPKKQFTCTICGKKSTRCDNMRTHVKSHKNDVIAAVNPMDFIMEESISEHNLAHGLMQCRPRLRGPRRRASKRLCMDVAQEKVEKSAAAHCAEENHPAVMRLVDVGPEKSKDSPVSSLPSFFRSMPGFKHQQYSCQLSFIASEAKSHEETTSQFIPVLTADQQQPLQH